MNGNEFVASAEHSEAVSDEGTLKLEHVNERHRGEFKCVATNSLGSDERRFTVNVHTAPIIADGDGTSVFSFSVQIGTIKTLEYLHYFSIKV